MEKGKRLKGDYEDGSQIDKTQVLQEARQCFMATSVKTKKLVDVLTKCVYILLQDERLASTEATDLFFHITRLFQYKDKDSTLRRLTYIGIKALSQQAENVYVVTSILTSDVNSSKDDPAIRASALRALCQISDASTFTSIERYLRQSVVDKHPVVASAAISSLVRVALINGEIVKRCTNEIQEALNSDSPMVQYHALGLRYNSCKNDRLAVSRLISNCIQQGLKSPLAICLLIRIIGNFIEKYDGEEARNYAEYIKNHLNHRTEMVEYEAANALISLKSKPAIDHLRNFLNSSKPALRFAAVRSLNKLAMTSPDDVKPCNYDLERLISPTDCNRSIAILAITILLKTGSKYSVDRFLKQIGDFLSEIDDGFKVIVVSSMRQLGQRHPSEHPAIMEFLSNMLREEGGYTYKRAIVDTIIKIIEDNESTKDRGLTHLCEFIEDCEHYVLAIEILNFLGKEGPKSKNPSTYIRFIANRLILDSAPVACAAISSLAKFAVVPELSETIKITLERFSRHEDYTVMERALFYKNILSVDDSKLQLEFIASPAPKISFSDLETKLMDYLAGDCDKPFNISNVASADITLHPMTLASEEIDDVSPEKNEERATATQVSSAPRPPLDVFDDIELGDVLKSTRPLPLTDNVSEFVVSCIIHVYAKHLVFQFDCTNTVNTMCLENVMIDMCSPAGYCLLAGTECPKLAFEESGSIYVCAEMVEDDDVEEDQCSMAYFTDINLKYNYKTVDPETNEPDSEDLSEDTFPLEDLLIDLSDLPT